MLAGIWWDFELNTLHVHGAQDAGLSCGSALAGQLFTDWSQITTGGLGENGAYPGTALEVYTVDDAPPEGDANIGNGTPNQCAIADAFRKHRIHCANGACPAGWDADANGVPDACPLVERDGSRYLTTIAGINETLQVDLRVSPNCSPTDRKYAAPDGSLVSTPVCNTPFGWSTVYLHGPEIVPGTQYTVGVCQSVGGGCTPGPCMLLGTATTWLWGDVDYSGVVDVDDIGCAIEGYAGCFQRCGFRALDIIGASNCVSPNPNGIIDLDDVSAVVDAFGGEPYPCPGPCSGGTAPLKGHDDGSQTQLTDAGLLTLVPDQTVVAPAGVVNMDVYLSDLCDVHGYQVGLELETDSGARFQLDGMTIDEDRTDFVFAGLTAYVATDPTSARMMGCVPRSAVPVPCGDYLGTFAVRAPLVNGAYPLRLRGNDLLLPDSNRQPMEAFPAGDVVIVVETVLTP